MTSSTSAPAPRASAAASRPPCPPPTTMTRPSGGRLSRPGARSRSRCRRPSPRRTAALVGGRATDADGDDDEARIRLLTLCGRDPEHAGRPFELRDVGRVVLGHERAAEPVRVLEEPGEWNRLLPRLIPTARAQASIEPRSPGADSDGLLPVRAQPHVPAACASATSPSAAPNDARPAGRRGAPPPRARTARHRSPPTSSRSATAANLRVERRKRGPA